MTKRGPKLGHGERIPGHQTDMGYYPDGGFSVVIQMNTDRKPMTDRIGGYAAVLARREALQVQTSGLSLE